MKVLNKRIIILSSVGFTILAGASVFAYQVNKPVELRNVTTTQVAPQAQESEPVEETPKIEVVAPPAPAATQTQPKPVAPEPKVYKWATEMAVAGIVEADYGYVTDLVLSDAGWRKSSEGRVWRLANEGAYRSCGIEFLVNCLARVNDYVIKNHGTWQQANYIWVRAGNF